MNNKKQKLLIEYLISSPDTFALCTTIVKPKYFDPEFRTAIEFIQNYYNEYNTLPDVPQIEAETGKTFTLQPIEKDKIEYCANEIESFCQSIALQQAILASAELYDAGKHNAVLPLIKEAVTISLNRDLGINFFENPKEQLMKLASAYTYQSTGWTEFDELIGGGLERKQMMLFSANSGGGKSIVMANLGLNFVEQGLWVLYISLELSAEMVYQRYIQMIAGTDKNSWKSKIDECAHKITSVSEAGGELFIKRMKNGTSANEIRAYLKEFELKYGRVPDVIIHDYIDLGEPNSSNTNDGVFEKDKQATEEFREIGEDYNLIPITAAQQNRSAVGAKDLNHSHIAGGISKINTTDNYASIILTDKMKASGMIQFQFLKTRTSDAINMHVTLDYNKTTLRITNQNSLPSLALKNNKDPIDKKEINIDNDLIGLMSSVN